MYNKQEHGIHHHKPSSIPQYVLLNKQFDMGHVLPHLLTYQKRYGFVYVDREEDENSGTLNRYKKDSYYWYKKVIETNGEEL